MTRKKSPQPKPGSDRHVGKVSRPLRVKALEVSQGDRTLYAFAAKASVLFASLSINRKIEDKDEGYQRVLLPSRIEAISRYVQKRPIPGAIIVSLDRATFDKKKSVLVIPKGTDVGWVIDGQHRLAGADRAAREGTDIDLAVVAFVGLNQPSQIEQFVTINREAKNVPTSLYLDLLKYMPNKTQAELAKERAADLATNLRKDEDSPFFERIAVVHAPKSGQVSLTNFARKISGLITKNGLLNSFNEREQLGIISNYYQAVRNVFPTEFDARESVFFKTVGFGALWNVFPKVFSMTLSRRGGSFTVPDVVSVLKLIENQDFSTWGQYGSGDQAERLAGEDFRVALDLALAAENKDPATPTGIKL